MTRTSKSGESGLDTTTQSGVTSQSSTKAYKCSFCHKKQDEVNRLIAGPSQVYICDECVMLCQEIISDSSDQKVAPLEGAAGLNASKSKLSVDFLKRSTAAMHAIDEMLRLAQPHASSLPPELPKQLLSAIAFAAQQIKDHFETEAASTQEEVLATDNS